MLFDSRRSEYAAGYLEFIWPINGPESPEGKEPQAIAHVADVCQRDRTHMGQRFVGVFRSHVVYGRNVAEVKAALFPIIEECYA